MGAFALAERFARKGKGGRKARVGRVICLIALSTRHARSHYSTTRAAATTHVSEEEFEPTNRARESLSLLRPTVLLPQGSNTIHTIEDHCRNLYRSYAGKNPNYVCIGILRYLYTKSPLEERDKSIFVDFLILMSLAE